MKSSLGCTTAAALRGFAGWVSGRGGDTLSDVEHVPFVVSACGYRPPEGPDEFGERDERWLPGLSVDNFS
jgi:hypothetical protein